MMISDEQARLAAHALRTADDEGAAQRCASRHAVPDELMSRVRNVLVGCPEMREDRVRDARMMLDGAQPSSREVAHKMISRIISDSLR